MRARGLDEKVARLVGQFYSAEEGATAVEYAVLMLITIAIIGALSFFTGSLIGAYDAVVDALAMVMA